ncbi:cupin domain-containing protein [Methyloprofundus sp.]|uniref:cupin domain-containing protein n=1 Tax=Methyloprofundus sp. TaxID=2020875 RepID=UPI003D0D9660
MDFFQDSESRCLTLCDPRGLDFSTQKMSMLHFVLEGVCWVKNTTTNEAIRLMQGDIVFFYR